MPGFVKNMGTTTYGMTAQYWKSVLVGFENRLVSRGLTLPQPKAARGIVLWDKNFGYLSRFPAAELPCKPGVPYGFIPTRLIFVSFQTSLAQGVDKAFFVSLLII